MDKYIDREHAGKFLANQLSEYANTSDVIILALPRGGVPVAYEIAHKLSAPLDVLIVRKLGVPGHQELAMGAISSGGAIVLNEELITTLGISEPSIERVIEAEENELLRRETLYHVHGPLLDLHGKTIVLVDDGIATGATMKVAIKALRQKRPAKIIVAVPVAARDTCNEMVKLADQLVCPLKPINFYAVGLWYENFSQTSDDEVRTLLDKAYLERNGLDQAS